MKRRGLSLIEVVISLTLISLIFMFVINLFPSALISARQAEHRTAANALAQELLDYTQAKGYKLLKVGSWQPGTLPNPDPFDGHLANEKLDDQVVLQPRVEIQSKANFLKEITVTVSWTERNRVLEIKRQRRVASLNR